MKLLSFVLVFIALVSSQVTETLVIDDFTVGRDIQSLSVTLASEVKVGGTPLNSESFYSESGCGGRLLGCDRDLLIKVTAGLQGRTFTSSIFTVTETQNFQGEWSVSSPKASESLYTIQYDGVDNSASLKVDGLGSIDLTTGGSSSFIRFSIVLDLDSVFTIKVYSPNGSTCTRSQSVKGTPTSYQISDTFFDFKFTDFTGSCSFSSVGAIEVTLPSNDALDSNVRKISVFGVPPSPSRTPASTASNTPGPSPSRSGSPGPSQSPTPTRAPSPSSSPQPPQFTWYTFDDDDNGRAPCDGEQRVPGYTFTDNNVIYYYFDAGNDSPSESSAGLVTFGASLLVSCLIFVF